MLTRRLSLNVVSCLLLAAVSGLALGDLPRWDRLNEPGCGGRFVSLQVSPFDSRTMLIGGDVFGVGLTKDGGENWEACTGFTTWEIGDFTWHPVDPNIAWVGTLSGPYKSTDGGRTWTLKRNGFPPAETDRGYTAPIQKICFDPNNVNTLLAFGGNHRHMTHDRVPEKTYQKAEASTRFGAVWKSTDGGETWTRLTTIDANGSGPADRHGVNIVNGGFAAGSSDIVYLCADEPQAGAGVYKSTDGGKSFARCVNGLPTTTVCFIALHPTDPNILWAALGNGGKVWKSTDGAATWKSSSTGMDPWGPEQSAATIVVCAKDPNVLYTHGVNWREPGPAYRSRDGGATWARMAKRGDESAIIGGHAYSQDGEWTLNWISVDPNNPDHVLLLPDDTAYQSWDGGKTRRDITSHRAGNGWRGNGYGGLAATAIKWNPCRLLQVFTLGSDDGKMLHSDDALWSWTVNTAPIVHYNGGRDVAFSRDGAIYLCIGQFNADKGESIAKSSDWGKTWRYLPRLKGAPKDAKGDNESVCTLPDDSKRVWAIIAGTLYKSEDGGETWNVLTLDKPGKLYHIVPDPANPLTLYIAAQKGIYRTTDGATFTLMPGSPGSDHVSNVAIDTATPGVIYVAAFRSGGKGVWRYDGKWTRIFDKLMAHNVAVDPANPKRLAVVTNDWPTVDISLSDGVWLTEDGGAHWMKANEGIGLLRGDSIAFNPDKSGQLIYGTSGGGGFYVTDWGVSRPFGGAVRTVQGTVQAANYDLGGEGVAFHSSGAKKNAGDGYRKDAVDIRAGGSGHVVCGLSRGDWLKYKFNVPATGYYDVTFRIASAAGGGCFHLEANGVNVTGPLSMPSTKDAATFVNVVAKGVHLHEGDQFLRLYVEAAGADVDSLSFAPSSADIKGDHEIPVRTDLYRQPA